MSLIVQKVDTWAAPLVDKPGELAAKLKALAGAGANLEFVIARRAPDHPGQGVVFVTPVKGPAALRAAKAAGFTKTDSLHTVRLEGADRQGEGAKVTDALAAKGINLRGLSAAAVGKKFIAHLALDTAADAAHAIRLLRALR